MVRLSPLCGAHFKPKAITMLGGMKSLVGLIMNEVSVKKISMSDMSSYQLRDSKDLMIWN